MRRIASADSFAAASCMAACELAPVQPTEDLIEPLLRFVSEPIEGYENIPGAGGKSTGDAAFSVSNLPAELQREAVPAICDRLDQARCFDTMPLVRALLSAAFPARKEPVTELTDFQKLVLTRMVNTEELWSVGNLSGTCGATASPRIAASAPGSPASTSQMTRRWPHCGRGWPSPTSDFSRKGETASFGYWPWSGRH